VVLVEIERSSLHRKTSSVGYIGAPASIPKPFSKVQFKNTILDKNGLNAPHHTAEINVEKSMLGNQR